MLTNVLPIRLFGLSFTGYIHYQVNDPVAPQLYNLFQSSVE
jgi:hypothetical protein